MKENYKIGKKAIYDQLVKRFPDGDSGKSRIGNKRTLDNLLAGWVSSEGKKGIASEPRNKPTDPYETHVNSVDACGNPDCDLFSEKEIAEFTGYGIRQTKTHIKTGWFPVDRTINGRVWSTQSSLYNKRKK